MAIHLRPTAPIAAEALLPGDPGRALALARDLHPSPRMSNHHRGLWGYYGTTADGRPLTIQSTGLGGPSAAIVLRELADLGLKRAIRIGTCVASSPATPLGSLLVAEQALAADGTSGALGAPELVPAAAELTAALLAAGPEARRSLVATTDLFYARQGARNRDDVAAAEMAAAPLFALGSVLGVEVACILIVSAGPGGPRISDQELAGVELRAGRIAAAALASVGANGAEEEGQLAVDSSETSSGE
jgi:uridine phosphorylase